MHNKFMLTLSNRLIAGLWLMGISISLNANEFSFINDNSIPLEERKNRINLIDVAKLDSDNLSVLIDTCSTSDASLAIYTFKTLQKRDDFKSSALLFVKRRFANAQETDSNLLEYLTVFKELYVLETPDSVKNPTSIYGHLYPKLLEIMKEASPINQILLLSNKEIVNSFLLAGKADEFFDFLPALVEHKWDNDTALKKLCVSISEFQIQNYPLPEQLFVNLKKSLSSVNDKEIVDIIRLMIQKYETEQVIDQEMEVSDLNNNKIDLKKRKTKLLQLLKKTKGHLFTSNPKNATLFTEIMFDEKHENQIRELLLNSLLTEMDKDTSKKNMLISSIYAKALEKLKSNPYLFNPLVLGTPSNYSKANENIYMTIAMDKNVPPLSRAATIYHLSYLKGHHELQLKSLAIQSLEELKEAPEKERLEMQDLLIGALQKLTGKDIDPKMSLEQVKTLCR